jgi:phosphotransferase system HPr-like phosphotransfer protein
MYISEKTIISPCDFESRFVRNLAQNIVDMKSTPYIATMDKTINAKSILGMLSADIKKDDNICIQVIHNGSQEQADNDLSYIMELICGVEHDC